MGKKATRKKPSVGNYKTLFKRDTNKKRRIEAQERRLKFFKLRNELMKELKLSKSDARREIRKRQKAGTIDNSLSPLKNSGRRNGKQPIYGT